MYIIILLVFILVNLSVVIFTLATAIAIFVPNSAMGNLTASNRLISAVYSIIGMATLYYIWVTRWSETSRIFNNGFTAIKHMFL